MFGATDWVLKRLAKFLLKRTLGRLLHPDVDMDLLEVALGSGSLAMHRVLLDCDRINELLVSLLQILAEHTELLGNRAVLSTDGFPALRTIATTQHRPSPGLKVALYTTWLFAFALLGFTGPPRAWQEWSGWELRAGFLGTVRVTVPLTALYTEPCSIEVHEALFTVRPRPPGTPPKETASDPAGAGLTTTAIVETKRELMRAL